MKQIPAFLIGLLLASNAFSAPVSENLQVGGESRNMLTHAPSGIEKGSPLLISMHGMNQDANYQQNQAKWQDIADTARFVVVYPNGINKGWDISGDKDINFILAIIETMSSRYQIDRDRVYLSGFSMGGMMTYHAMGRIADKIAAFAPVSGYPMGGSAFQSSRPIPIIHTHGTTDDVVGYSGVNAMMEGWRKRNGCPAQSQTITPYPQNKPNSKSKLTIWEPCDEDVKVELLTLDGKGHWHSNDDAAVHSSKEIWNFIKNYSLTGTVGAGLRFVTKSDISLNQGVTQVAKLEAKAKDDGAVSFSISGGADKDLFNLSGSDLSFKEAPAAKQYKVSITATSGDEKDTLDLTVTVFPYKGEVWAIPGKIEAENYDSFSDLGGATEEAAAYRADQVDVIKSITGGYAVGHTQAGEWLEYKVDVKEEGAYALEANVVSGNDGSSFRLFIDDAPITDTVKVGNTDADYKTYSVVTAKTSKLTKGSHVLRLEITGNWVDIDWLSFGMEGATAIETPRYPISDAMQYRVYDLQGAYKGTWKASDLTSLQPGAYIVRSTDGSIHKLIGVAK
jgi:poly(3-hydroxybutyrate) depolymerase